MSQHIILNLLDLLESTSEDEIRKIFSGFSCPKNPEIESFLQKNAIEFTQRKMSITYLVIDEQQRFVGYFTLTHKSALIPANNLSKTSQKKLALHARLDESTNCYDVSAFLIAQLGKNYSVENGNTISGNLLMSYVFNIFFYI